MTSLKVKLEAYNRALAGESQLRAIAATMDALVTVAPDDQPFCAGYLWELILKPLLTPRGGSEATHPGKRKTPPRAATP